MLRQMFTLATCLGLGAGLLSTPVFAEEAGRIVQATGSVSISRGGLTIPVQGETVLQSGDVLTTGDSSVARLQMADEALFAIGSQSRFAIKEYSAPAGGGASGKSIYSLEQGKIATITGKIKAADRYRMETPVARVEVQGTQYKSAMCRGGSCKNSHGTLPDGAYIAVSEGSIVVANAAGKVSARAGQYVYVASDTTLPVVKDGAPDIFADADANFSFEFDADFNIDIDIERPASPS